MKPLFHILTLAALLGSSASAFALSGFEPALLAASDTPQSAEAQIWLIDSDDDYDGGWDDDDEEEDDDDDCEDDDDDDDYCGGGKRAKNPAKSGTVSPPNNGLFGNGQAPKVITN